ncbi:CNH domain containing protein [Amanita muscaria]
MDRPLGPRQPGPDKRSAAYESIFGRPGGSQHQVGVSQLVYPPYHQQSPRQQVLYHQYQQSYHPLPDRNSFGSTYAQSAYNHPTHPSPHHHGHPNPYTQPYPPHMPQYPQQPPLGAYPLSHHPSTQSLYPPASVHSRERSIASSAQSPGIITSQPPEPLDRTLEPFMQQGLTPAQAYQAQFYSNDNPGSQPGRYNTPSPHVTSSQRGTNDARPDVPRLSLSLDDEDSRLDIDFGGTGPNGNGSDQGTDEDSSELPWARKDDSASMNASSRRRSPRTEDSHSAKPLHVVTSTVPSVRSDLLSSSPASSTADHGSTLVEQSSIAAHRKSSDSTRTVPRVPGSFRQRTVQDRSMSMSAASTMGESKRATRFPTSAGTEGRDSPTSVRVKPRKTPIVYPALLSRVAEAFRERIPLSDRVKDGLTYKNSFDGRDAVDKIAYIIKTTDRNLALLLGRALDAQKFFHDVTYDHRLRDSPSELYQFRTRLPSPYVSGDVVTPEDGGAYGKDGRRSSGPPLRDSYTEDKEELVATLIQQPRRRRDSMSSDESPLPTGVFTLLTDCYSPTCSRDQLCYSIACPRRLEQQARLNMKPQPGLSKQMSRESLADVVNSDVTLWVQSVPPEIVNSVSDTEKKRQEAINEVIYTERDFVRDMEYLRDFWVTPLKEKDVVPKERRMKFITDVFWNYQDIIPINTKLRDALIKRQKSYAVVEKIGDVLLESVPSFSPFVAYGSHQVFGKFEFEKEKSVNPVFMQFVEVTERLPESRKLELNAYLTKPTTRLARYPLLLEAVLKHTPKDSPDKTLLPQVIATIKDFLTKVNAESGKSENRFQLAQLNEQLYYKPGEEVQDLRLTEEGREIIHRGALAKRDGELQVYLFDHAILFTKLSKNKQHEQYRVYRKPIPLELLCISASEDSSADNGRRSRHLMRRNSLGKDHRGLPLPPVTIRTEGRGQYWINFIHLGRKYYQLMLWANSPVSHKKWLEWIYKQQQAMRERSLVFVTVTLSENYFVGANKVNCAAPFGGGRRIVYGTNDGVYISDLREPNREPVKVLSLLDVTQIDVLEDYQLLIVLSERQVITFPLEALDPIDPMAGLKRAKRISSHTSFFKAGQCLNKVLVCIVKSSQLSSTFKTLEPIDQNVRGRSKPTFRKLLQGGNDTLKLFREFYIPVESTSIHFLKTKLCVGCSRGFEIVDLESLDTQGLLDPNDESLEFVRRRENLRPMAIYRIQNEFLLCYDEFAFYVNKSGRRTRREFMVYWEGMPTGFALHESFVLAIEPTFVEIRDINTGSMIQVIQGSNLRLLFADTPPTVNYGGSMGNGYATGYDNGGYPGGLAYAPSSHSGGGYGTTAAPQVPGYARTGQGGGREEILVVSDDRVLALRVK